MIEAQAILQAKTNIDVIGLVIFVVIAAVASLFQWLAKQRQEEKRKQQQSAAKGAGEQAERPGQGAQPGQPPRQVAQLTRQMPRAQRQAGQRMQPPPPPIRTKPKPPRPVVLEDRPEDLGAGAIEAQKRQAARLRKQEQQRHRRLAARKSPEADTAAIEAHLLHIRPGAGPDDGQGISYLAPELNLAQRDALRRAILYHEIFSPPKALRQDRELWEI